MNSIENSPQISWQWLNSQKASHICAVLAWHDMRIKLINYLLTKVNKKIHKQLQIITNKDVIVLIGKEENLPWIDGLQYAGYDKVEPRLWRPSHKEPNIPAPLLADSLCQYYQQSVLLIWDKPKIIIPINKAQIVDDLLLNIIADSVTNHDE